MKIESYVNTERKIQQSSFEESVEKKFQEHGTKGSFGLVTSVQTEIIMSYIRLANHHEETQKKVRQGKTITEREVQLRKSQKHVGMISRTF